MLGSKCVKTVDGVSERSCCPYMLPGESGQARLWKVSKEATDSVEFGELGGVTLTAKRSNGSVDRFDKDTLSMDL